MSANLVHNTRNVLLCGALWGLPLATHIGIDLSSIQRGTYVNVAACHVSVRVL